MSLSRRASARPILAIALGRAAILAGYAAQFTTATALVAGLVKAHASMRLEERLLALSKPKLLIVDELGYLPLEPQAAHLFFQLVSRRYEKGAMLITSNRNVGEWGTVFADPVVATAILDRLRKTPLARRLAKSHRLARLDVALHSLTAAAKMRRYPPQSPAAFFQPDHRQDLVRRLHPVP